MSLANALYLSCLLATVHRQSGCGAAEQPSGDCCCDEKNSGECKLFLTEVRNHGKVSLYLALLGISIKPVEQSSWSDWDSDCGCFRSTTWRKFRSLICALSFSRQEFSHVLHHCCHVSFEARHWSVIPPCPLAFTASSAPL